MSEVEKGVCREQPLLPHQEGDSCRLGRAEELPDSRGDKGEDIEGQKEIAPPQRIEEEDVARDGEHPQGVGGHHHHLVRQAVYHDPGEGTEEDTREAKGQDDDRHMASGAGQLLDEHHLHEMDAVLSGLRDGLGDPKGKEVPIPDDRAETLFL